MAPHPETPAAPLASEFRLEVLEVDGERAVAAVHGEVDVSSAAQLREGLYQLLADGRRDLTVDLVGMTFIDSTGLGVLVGVLKRAREAGGELTLRGPNKSARKVLEISGLARIVGLTD